jgi:dihydropyrimidine dehydrogenase (NAD+) subunit PreT
VIFDANPQPGGLDTYGIAAYKMRAQDTLKEIDMLRKLGVDIKSGVTVGEDVSLASLESEYDAIFLGIGLGETDDLSIPGETLHGCMDALSFIEQTKSRSFDQITIASRIAVIGGGNTAIDAVTAARRLGAEVVYMVYRRSQEEMSAFDYELELARQDGVNFVWQVQPVRVIDGGAGHVAALECVRTQAETKAAGKRRSFAPVPGSEFRLDVEMVIKALGQKRKIDFLKQIPDLQLANGCVTVNPDTMQTSNPRYFAGGDCINGGGEVVDAVAHGKKAAAGIHHALETSHGRRTHA